MFFISKTPILAPLFLENFGTPTKDLKTIMVWDIEKVCISLRHV